MQLYLMRHGDAGYSAHSDKARGLTEIGRYQTIVMSSWLAESVIGFELVLVSPYLRTQQTWQKMRKDFSKPSALKVLDDLIPSANSAIAVDTVLAYAKQFKAQKVLIIGHMPLLGYMVSELVSGVEPPIFATSGVTLIDQHKGKYAIDWQHTPCTINDTL